MNRRDVLKFFGLGTTTIPAVKSIELLQMDPDDVLVVKVDCPMTQENAERIRALLQDKLGGRKVLVIDGQVELAVLRGGGKLHG